MNTAAKILARHEKSLRGRLRLKAFKSKALGILKPYYIYEPPGFAAQEKLPVLYLFRGHEREWVNFREDSSRLKATAIEDLDKLMRYHLLPPLLVVMPGLNSTNNHIPSLGIDMVGQWPARLKGLGTGRFWTYLTAELFPFIEKKYPQTNGALRLMAGFSLGGYTVSMLSTRLAGYFQHAAIYDGTLMWPGHSDPRVGDEEFNDNVWCRSALFDPAFGSPRDTEAMQGWNASDRLAHAAGTVLHNMQRTRFWVASAARDGQYGNRDRAQKFAELLRKKGLKNGFSTVVFDDSAAHTWHWADRFLVAFLLQALHTGETPITLKGLAGKDADRI